MRPQTCLATARASDGRELVLYERAGVYTLRVGGWELMSSRAHGSEEALARVACAHLLSHPAPRVLVGGLGMGYTLAAVLREVGPSAQVAVAEIFPAVIAWNRGVLAPLAGSPLDDPRVQAVAADVGTMLRTGFWDAILLDVDNGPAALTVDSNERLYSAAGVKRLATSLRPGGRLVVWSAAREPWFDRRVQEAGLRVRVRRLRARGAGGGPSHWIFEGRLPRRH